MARRIAEKRLNSLLRAAKPVPDAPSLTFSATAPFFSIAAQKGVSDTGAESVKFARSTAFSTIDMEDGNGFPWRCGGTEKSGEIAG
jgi:hypothetical protein